MLPVGRACERDTLVYSLDELPFVKQLSIGNIEMLEKSTISLSIIVALFGRFSFNQLYLGKIQRHLRDIDDNQIETIFVFAGDKWSSLPTTQTLPHHLKNVSTIYLADEALPAQLYNAGAKLARGRRLTFLSPDIPCNPRQLSILASACKAAERENDIIAVADQILIERYRLPHQPTENLAHGWLTNCPVFDLSNVCIPCTTFHRIHGFDETPILQQDSGWDLLIRATENTMVRVIDTVVNDHLADLPTNFPRPLPVSADMRRRYVARSPLRQDREAKFLADLPQKEREYLKRHVRTLHDPPHSGQTKPLKITITGSFWEHHHNWLCFLSYLRHLEGSGFATHKNLFDHLLTRSDIEDSDVVILSRCKVDEVRQILNWCNELGIASIYMIDDNWLTVARDWPDPYQAIFSPGTPFYDNFMFGARNADAVLTYNSLLKEDIAPFARKTISLPNSVDLLAFEKTARRESSRFLVGYSGSPRYSSAPFKALARVARGNPDVDLILFGILRPEHERELDGCNVIRLPQTSYSRYAELIRAAGPDILLAPMDDSRTSRSKCPNKYLEITAAGAVGVYSKLEPYTWFVNDGINGAFVLDSEDEASWAKVINSLLDKELLLRMHTAARENVLNNYTVPVVAPAFAKLLAETSVGAA